MDQTYSMHGLYDEMHTKLWLKPEMKKPLGRSSFKWENKKIK
jgi:hypothetical protein